MKIMKPIMFEAWAQHGQSLHSRTTLYMDKELINIRFSYARRD